MKKFSLILALMLSVSVATFASTAKCLLHHNGNVTLYDASNLNDALTAAVNGDTIYLSEGNFDGFTITKKITVRGSGQMTRIGGDIIVDIPDAPTLTSALLEGFLSNADIMIKSAVNGLQIKQCKFRAIYARADVNNALLDKVFITNNLFLSEYWCGLTCVNSKILYIKLHDYFNSHYSFLLSTASIVINNCNVRYLLKETNQYKDYITVTNSIIRSSSTLYESNIINCLYDDISYDAGTSVVESCYKNDYSNNNYLIPDDATLECRFDAAALKSNGYLGQDGTIVGCYGGTNPFTLELKGPKVTESSIQIDNDTKQLSVTLKVTAN